MANAKRIDVNSGEPTGKKFFARADQLRIHEAEMSERVVNELEENVLLTSNCEEKIFSSGLFTFKKRLRNAGESLGIGG